MLTCPTLHACRVAHSMHRLEKPTPWLAASAFGVAAPPCFLATRSYIWPRRLSSFRCITYETVEGQQTCINRSCRALGWRMPAFGLTSCAGTAYTSQSVPRRYESTRRPIIESMAMATVRGRISHLTNNFKQLNKSSKAFSAPLTKL